MHKTVAKKLKFLQEKAEEMGLSAEFSDSGDLYVEGDVEDVRKFRQAFKSARQCAIKALDTSGLRPLEYKVVVYPDPIQEKAEGSRIVKPETTMYKEQEQQVYATFIAKGSRAFEDWSDDEQQALVPGTRVILARYAGYVLTGADGKRYQVINDKELVCISTEQ